MRIFGGWCSDDGFEYFRLWLIGRGRDAFEQTVAQPDALGELPEIQCLVGRHRRTWDDDKEWPEWESLDYLASQAYGRAVGDDDVRRSTSRWGSPPTGMFRTRDWPNVGSQGPSSPTQGCSIDEAEHQPFAGDERVRRRARVQRVEQASGVPQQVLADLGRAAQFVVVAAGGGRDEVGVQGGEATQVAAGAAPSTVRTCSRAHASS